ncbi:MAG TPA: PQQ-dependent sugar dehydrogenase [Solirubrobacterales bacterium]|jgi:glucose/arabinose dehydrogenase|nr:PQQ-dependent sugar dehydrogenase [Solirubrobacterales bacterium]
MRTPVGTSRAGLSLALLLVVLGFGAIGAGSARAGELTLPSGFRDETVFSALEEPTMVGFAPNGEVFVAEKTGTILVYEGLSDPEPEVFAELSTAVFDKGDRGLLGLAIDPGYPAEPYVYALYTFDHVLLEEAEGEYPRWGSEASPKGDPCPLPPGADVDDCPVSGRLVRLTAEFAGGHVRAAEGSLPEHPGAPEEEVLLEDWCQQDVTHSIGDLAFGPEGALYVSGGEGAGYVSPDYGQIGWPHPNMCGDPPSGFGLAPSSPTTAEGGSLRAQDVLSPEDPISHADPTSLDGSLLRVNPDTGEGWPSNPLAGSADQNARRIIATGFRNPFRFAIDPAGGHAYVDNVGSSEYEEIDQVPLESEDLYNSGWPCLEGPEHQFLWRELHVGICEYLYAHPGLVSQPLFDYSHDSEVLPGDHCPYGAGSAITGNTIYRGGAFPADYEGALFFADSVRDCIWTMTVDEHGEPDPSTLRLFASGEQGVYDAVDIEVGPEGDLYYVGKNSGIGTGSVHRISYHPNAPLARLRVDQPYGSEGRTFHFDAGESSDPQGNPLSYEWDFGNGVFVAGGREGDHVFNDAENHTVSVRVDDTEGNSSLARVTVYPGDAPPAAEILTPEGNLEWHVGQTIEFSGRAKDAEGASLRYTHLYWDARLLHCPFGPTECHAHPLQLFPAVESGSFLAPDHDYPSYVELVLTATDSRGLAGTAKVKLKAEPVTLTVASSPSGVPLVAGQLAGPAPFSVTAIMNSHLTLSAPQVHETGGRRYTFERWSDSGAAAHTVFAGAPSLYTAFYSAPGGSGALGPVAGGGPAVPLRVRITSRPPARTKSPTARFAFGSNVPGARFRCRLDRSRFGSCGSPKIYRRLEPGRHRFAVEASVAGSGTAAAKPVAWEVLPRTRR